MDKREFELAKLAQKAKMLESVVGLVKIGVICASVLFSIKLIVAGIIPMIGQNADQIKALANFVQSFQLGSIFGYVLAGICGCAWAIERSGKQRAITQKSHYQEIAENNEPNRGTSGLTKAGLTPSNT